MTEVEKCLKAMNSKLTKNDVLKLKRNVMNLVNMDKAKIEQKPNKAAEKRIKINETWIAAYELWLKLNG